MYNIHSNSITKIYRAIINTNKVNCIMLFREKTDEPRREVVGSIPTHFNKVIAHWFRALF